MSMDFLPKPKTLDFYEVVKHEFATAFANFINLYNLLEINIGLCLRLSPTNPELRATNKQLDSLSFHGKLQRLTKLVDQQAFATRKKGLRNEYHSWLQVMDETRTARNRYIHGYWDVYPAVERSVRFRPMAWEESETKRCTEEMTLPEFLEQMKELSQTFDKFMHIRRKFDI